MTASQTLDHLLFIFEWAVCQDDFRAWKQRHEYNRRHWHCLLYWVLDTVLSTLWTLNHWSFTNPSGIPALNTRVTEMVRITSTWGSKDQVAGTRVTCAITHRHRATRTKMGSREIWVMWWGLVAIKNSAWACYILGGVRCLNGAIERHLGINAANRWCVKPQVRWNHR